MSKTYEMYLEEYNVIEHPYEVIFYLNAKLGLLAKTNI